MTMVRAVCRKCFGDVVACDCTDLTANGYCRTCGGTKIRHASGIRGCECGRPPIPAWEEIHVRIDKIQQMTKDKTTWRGKIEREANDIIRLLISTINDFVSAVESLTGRSIEDGGVFTALSLADYRNAQRNLGLLRAIIRGRSTFSRTLGDESRYVYFVRQACVCYPEGPIKIGSADNVAQRLGGLQTSSPYEVVLLHSLLGGYELERRLHEEFAEERLFGEWFEPSKRLTEFIEKLRTEAA